MTAEPGQILNVPPNLSRNDVSVRKQGSPEQTGAMLIDYMCQRIGIESLAGREVLDFGCGVRFSQAILNLGLPVGSYTGIDVHMYLIDFLRENVCDSRFRYHHSNVKNDLYNPGGVEPGAGAASVLGDATFDIACMFSVVTHQNPAEAAHTFRVLKDHVRPSGDLFFSAFTHSQPDGYIELVPDRPGLKSSYPLEMLTDILQRTGWSVVSIADPRPDGLPIMTSLHCRRA